MFALKVFICVLALTVVSDAQTSCTNTQTIANPSNLPSGALTLKVTAPSTTKFQLIQGSSWSIKVLQNATHLKATSAYSTSSGFTLTFTSSETNGVSPSSLSSPFIIVLSILSGLMAMKSSSGADMRFVFLILGLSLIPFVLSASELDCTNGTVIITYPSGSSVTVNGVGANGCVDTNGYFTLVQNGNQCWGSGGSACATPSGCCGCCASGLQCGGSAQYDNQYWIGCRPTGTSGGITNATCNAVSSSGGTTTAAPTTTPHSGTTTAAPVGNKKLYCPSSNDLVAAYGSPSITNRGWSITGGAAVATKASYNLIGGWVSYTANWASVPTGVNANIYSVSPNFGGASSFTNAQYCDGQAATSTKPWCVEIDWIESNGNCGGQTTLHTSNINGNGNSGATNVCGTSGCLNNYVYSGTASFPMNVSFTSAGVWNVVWNGHTIGGSSVTPAAGSGDWAALLNAYTQLGAVIYSSQWTGWVPTPGSCSSTQGNLAAATFTISNLQIYGSVVQGPTPTSC